MNEIVQERRARPRAKQAGAIEVLADDKSYPGTLSDISVAGVQVRLDPVTFDEIREKIDAVRLDGRPPLAIRLQWGFFDGRFGASFREPLVAERVIEEILRARAKG